MNDSNKIRLYAWVEFLIWLIVIALCVFGIRYHNYKVQKQYKSYQIFMHDVDGLIVGSPVRFLGIKIGHVTKVQLVSSDVYKIMPFCEELMTRLWCLCELLFFSFTIN